ncbi:MAG TPA: PEGA domain-containing protein [Candidatus Krumholzibacteria bacterium]|nr:PEGA domain-containing protein [Candidatus Krumholzibacteria bacterium]HPD72467.1 PEGA domain-containing protein [Candidatus Krumholzibacteria bacterium]HRY40601.1 PEGA domain-containing protein [Candidatus Krumholzibacteria bacterium]
MRRTATFAALIIGAVWFSGCGSEPPAPGDLAVTSAPDGATITIDGVLTDRVTPAVFTGLEGGTYRVGVSRDDIVYRPDVQDVDVPYGGRVDLHFATEAGILSVTSAPAGGAIVLDGVDTGFTTPHTFGDLDPGQYTVDVVLRHHRSEPAEHTVIVERSEETVADFELLVASVVLFEGFSNVRCTGCPDLVAAIDYLMHGGGYGFDRFVYVKYAGPVPFALDPLYRSNMAMVNARSQYYAGVNSFALPTLFTLGRLSGAFGSPAFSALAGAIEAGNLAPIDFYLTVEAPNVGDLAERNVPCEITLIAPYTAVDLAAYELRAVLVYSEVTTAIEYDPGGDEYHWVARQDAAVATSLGTVAPEAPLVVDVALDDPDPATNGLTPHGREVIVFVQHTSSKSIIQAGSTMTWDPDDALSTRRPHSGGTR